ncbi:MAG: phospholipase D-like domain-containing protein [Ignavibacteriaceae bacterium]|jgi:phosphatidylserine/phosphatidylglycerophosphate/cardiolipin synthase-like enzyme
MNLFKNNSTNVYNKAFSLAIFFLILFLSTLVYGQAANHVVISEVAPMGGSSSVFTGGEFIELYNPFSSDITFGPGVKIVSGSTTATANAAEWQLSLAGKTIKGYGFLLIGQADAVVTPDVVFPGNKNLANSGIRSGVALLDGAAMIDAFAWDGSTTIPTEGTKFTPSSTTSDKKSFARKSGSAATANDNLGNAWDSNNNSSDFFECNSATANPQNTSSPIEVNPYNISSINGPGSVSVLPGIWKFNDPTTLTFNIKPSTGEVIQGLKIVKPKALTWLSSDFSVLPNTITMAYSADSTVFSGFSLSGTDSIILTISNVTSSDTTAEFTFSISTSSDGITFAPIKLQPKTLIYGAPIPILEAKVNNATGVGLRNGEFITLRGIVTVGVEFGSPSAMQDNSGGISVYGSAFSDNVKVGDEVLVTGRLTQFSGLNQIELPIVHSILTSNNQLDPLVVTPTQLSHDGQNGVENYEGLLVRLNGVSVAEMNGSPVTNWAYKNYMLTGSSPSDTVQIRIDNNTTIIGSVAPAGKFDILGILSQYKSNAPFIGGYQFMPRIPADIISNGPIIDKYPEEVEITSSSIGLNWGTLNPGTSRVRYGKSTNYEMGVISPDDALVNNHFATVTGLDAATIYNLQAFSVANSDTSFSGNIISSTSSGAQTTGEINVYFNKSVNTSVSSGVNASGNVDFKAHLIKRINNAKRSIDIATYSLSGTVGADIATALINAKNRGVKIRVIGEYDNTTAPWTTLQNNGIPVIKDRYGSNDGTGLMHDKFYIIDYRGGAADSVWVITGSWNATDPGTNDDRQNVIEFQDVALAGAYQIEFEEMWGSSTEQPNAQNSRFGARKLNNTPHTFIIGGKHVESYFSPSDRTTAFIGKTLGRAKKSINASLLTFTRRELADSVISLHKRGLKTRIVTDNNTDTGNQFSYLQSNGVDIMLKVGTGLLHHKYAIVDGESGETPYLITGSHNWSSAAENSNDENTVIIQDELIANLYLQEFTARYYEAGGKDSVFVGIDSDNSVPSEYQLAQNYPNPFNPSTTIQYSLKESGKVDLDLYNMLGQKVLTLVNEFQSTGNHQVKFDASQLATGVYIYRIKANDFSASKKLLLLK